MSVCTGFRGAHLDLQVLERQREALVRLLANQGLHRQPVSKYKDMEFEVRAIVFAKNTHVPV